MSGANDRTGVGSGSDEWRTPPDLFARLNRTFGFDYDAFASPGNALCGFYSTAEGTYRREDWCDECKAGNPHETIAYEDGFTYRNGEWFKWFNPPYSRGLIERAVQDAADTRNIWRGQVGLIPANTDTRWWHDIVVPHASRIEFLRGRVRFLRPDGTPGGAPPNGSALVYYFPDWRT